MVNTNRYATLVFFAPYNTFRKNIFYPKTIFTLLPLSDKIFQKQFWIISFQLLS